MYVVATPARAHAFDFSEHEYITREALVSLMADPPPPLTQGDVMAALRTLGVALDTNLCPIDAAVFADPAARVTCFLPSDIAAMSGDHSGSPLLLKWRFFDGDVQAHTPSAFRELVDTLTVVSKLESTCAPPENAISVTPLPPGNFLRAIRPHTLPTPEIPLPPEDVFGGAPLGAVDYSYVTLASNGCSHFRDVSEYWLERVTPSSEVRRVLAEQRYFYELGNDPTHVTRSKPNLNSLAWYTDLHAGAMAFARASRLAPSPAKEQLLGMAMTFELSSLHFLEDSVAAGHTVTDAKHLSNLDKKAHHDAANTKGIEEVLPASGCDLLRKMHPAPSRAVLDACAPGAKVRIFGDHILFSRPLDGALTKELAEALVTYSVERVLLAGAQDERSPDPLSSALAECVRSPTPDDAAWSWPTSSPPAAGGTADSDWFYRCGFAWWEATDQRLASKFISLDRDFASGQMAAIDMLPMPSSTELARLRLGTSDPSWSLPGGCGRCEIGRPARSWPEDAGGVFAAVAALCAFGWRRRR